MSRRIGIVTDSTAYLPDDVVAQRDVAVVPLQVIVGATAYVEGLEATSHTVSRALLDRQRVSTSRPAPAAFLDAYERAAHAGCDGVVSVHLSAEMSGTVDSAALAAKEAPLPVRVLDSRSLGMGLGYSVLAALNAADEGAPLDDVAAAAEKRAARTEVIFYVDTMEYLRRGGRIGAGAAFLGSALAMKPLLRVVDGHVYRWERCGRRCVRSRGWRRSPPNVPARHPSTLLCTTWRTRTRRRRWPTACGFACPTWVTSS